MTLSEHAPAKVNLTLKVIGKRADGYHELVSLAAFASQGDKLALDPQENASLSIKGPFAGDLGDDNLVLQAVKLLQECCPGGQAGAFTLEKQIPVAAGLGGGSADAAAALRLMARASSGAIPHEILVRAAGLLGADVPVCLASKAALMRGRGDHITEIAPLPALPAVLVNPGVALATGDVFAALNAPLLNETSAADDRDAISFGSADDLVAHILDTGNDLEPVAIELAPVIADAGAALRAMAGCRMAQMSGSGSTCFGIFGDADEACSAARSLSASHPHWWVVATQLS